MRAEEGMGRRSVDREVDAKDKRFSRYKGAARARRFGDDTAGSIAGLPRRRLGLGHREDHRHR